MKFTEKRCVEDFLAKNGHKILLKQLNGSTQEIIAMDCDEEITYVRLLELPPEAMDDSIEATMRQYGKVKDIAREKQRIGSFAFHTGVLTVTMVLDKPIPNLIRLLGDDEKWQARVYYQGMAEACFTCGSTEHKKAECPKSYAKKLKSADDEKAKATAFPPIRPVDEPLTGGSAPVPSDLLQGRWIGNY